MGRSVVLGSDIQWFIVARVEIEWGIKQASPRMSKIQLLLILYDNSRIPGGRVLSTNIERETRKELLFCILYKERKQINESFT